MFEGGRGHEMLIDAYMREGGFIRNAYVSILKAVISKSKFAYDIKTYIHVLWKLFRFPLYVCIVMHRYILYYRKTKNYVYKVYFTFFFLFFGGRGVKFRKCLCSF